MGARFGSTCVHAGTIRNSIKGFALPADVASTGSSVHSRRSERDGKEFVLHAHGRVDAEDGLAFPAERSMLLPLGGVAVSAFVLMALFEHLKIDIDPGITPWRSSAASIVFSGMMTTGLAWLARRQIF